MTVDLRLLRYRLARSAAVTSLRRSVPSPFAGEGRNSATLVVSLMLRLVIPLHGQLVAGVQGTAAGNHEDGRHRRSLAVRDDPGIIPFAITAEDYEKLAFGSVRATITRPSGYGSGARRRGQSLQERRTWLVKSDRLP